MKKIGVLVALLFATTLGFSQKIALVDMEYILKNVPSYESANEQLNQVSKKWQKEIDTMKEEIETMYKNYETQSVFLSDDMKKKAEDDIVEKEKTLNTLKRKYFGPDGEFYKKRESLMKPIQDEIYNAVKSVAEEKQYQMVLDRAS
ncbi:MAG: OmpH family outer membrane protein, partial [Paludibacteraceae bacterium]|nr:OmpH family outer membrane protein [Paludibacteraceae bacterium]